MPDLVRLDQGRERNLLITGGRDLPGFDAVYESHNFAQAARQDSGMACVSIT